MLMSKSKTRIVSFLVLSALWLLGCASVAPATYTGSDFSLSGKWKIFHGNNVDDPSKHVIAEFYEEGGSFYSKTLLMMQPFDEMGKPKVYSCPEFQGQSYVGVVVIRNMKKEGNIYSGGEAYSSKECGWFAFEITPISKDEISVLGFVPGLKGFGRRTTWTRADDEYDRIVNERSQAATTDKSKDVVVEKPVGILGLGTVFQFEGKNVTVFCRTPPKCEWVRKYFSWILPAMKSEQVLFNLFNIPISK